MAGVAPAGGTEMRACQFEAQILKTVRLNYLLFLPPDSGAEARWPLILFLHGVGERGNNLDLVTRHGIPRRLRAEPDPRFLVAAPQCRRGTRWLNEIDALNALLEELVAALPVERDRIYLTGMSMGGYGAWHLATAYPHWFAALAPVCGGGEPDRACALRDIPIWAFHGARDEGVPPSESQAMVEAVRACGGNARLTLYPECGHDAWTPAYDNPELYLWFLEQRRRTPGVEEPGDRSPVHATPGSHAG